MSKAPAMFRPFVRYAEFNGRSNRAEFWLFLLFVYAVEAVLYGALYLMSLKNGSFDLDTFLPRYLQFSPLISLFGLGIIVPILAVQVRRLHDINRSGWWLLMPIVISVIAYVVFLSVKGEELFGLMMTMGQQMESQQTSNPMAMMNPVAILKLEWPMFKLMIPWVILPSLGGQLVLFIFLLLPGTKGDNRFGAPPKA